MWRQRMCVLGIGLMGAGVDALLAACPGFLPNALYSPATEVIAADFNGDRRPDLAITYAFANNLTIGLQNGDGSYSFLPPSASGGGEPAELLAADFNRDGRMDIAYTVRIVNQEHVAIRIGNGDGTFGEAQTFNPGEPFGLAAVDFNRDGIADLAVTRYIDNSVSMHFGDGAGGIASSTTFPAGTAFPEAIIGGDLNGDGNPDLAMTTSGSRVAIVMGNGTGGAASTAFYGLSSAARSIAMADFNRDGKPDLVVPTSNSVTLLLNNGNGTFTVAAPVVFPSSGDLELAVAVADFNGDGNTDVVRGTTGSAAILFGDGAAGFIGQPLHLQTGSFPPGIMSLVATDFDLDGRVDLVAVAASATLFTFRNQSVCAANCGTFGTPGNIAAGTTPAAMATADLNRDGILDLAVANSGSNDVSVLHGNGSGGFVLQSSYAAGTVPSSVAVADLNRDGRLDLAVANRNSDDVSVLLQNSGGTFDAATSYAAGGAGADNPDSIIIGDFNHDGRPDLAVTNRTTRQVSILINSGLASLFPAVTNIVTGNVLGDAGPRGIAAADLNGDGALDLAIAEFGGGVAPAGAVVLLGDGSGGFTAASGSPFLVHTGATAVAVVDANRDGRLDLAVANRDSDDVSILLQNGGSFGFAAPVHFAADDSPLSIAGGDFDRDGIVDLAVANSGANDVSVLRGNGDGTYQTPASAGAVTTPLFVVAGDFDRDGTGDLVAAAATVRPIINDCPSADVSITKTHAGDFAQGNSGRTYTISVTNSGTVATSGGVTVTDTLPAGLTATALAGTSWSCDLPSLTCTRGDALAAANTYTPITLTVDVAHHAEASVTNTAGVSVSGDFNDLNNVALDPTTIAGVPDLTIAKTHAGDFIAGESGTYTITVSNVGGAATSGDVTVTDALPEGLSAISIDGGPGWSCTLATLTCTRGDALAGSSSYAPITLVVAAADDAPLNVINSAAVSGGGQVNTVNDAANDPTLIRRVPDLIVTKSHSGNFTHGQSDAAYTITVQNIGNGSALAAVAVVDTLPAGLTPLSMTGTGWSCTVETATCTTEDDLAAGESYPPITLTVSVAMTTPPLVTNVVSVLLGGDHDPSNNEASDPTTVEPIADLTITKTHSGDFTQAQSGATYTIVVANDGTAPSSGTVTVVDTLPAGLTATALSGDSWDCTLATRTCTRSDTLAAGASYPPITLTVDVSASAPPAVVNTATVSGGGEALDPTSIVQLPDLTIAKSHSGSFTQGQSGATYTIVVTNAGVAPTSSGVSVVDTLPAGLTATAIAGDSWDCTLATLTCSRTDALGSGDSYPPITVTVDVATTAPPIAVNSATVSGGGQAITSNDTASDPTTIVQLPDLTVAKSHIGNFARGQAGAAYSIVVTNSGDAATSGAVTITDSLPAGLTATSIGGAGWSCTFATLTCSRADSLAASASYPPVTLIVNVAADAPLLVTNVAVVSGGGQADTTNDTASDPTTVLPVPDLVIAKTHSGDFRAGQAGTYTIVVSNIGEAPTAGAVSISDSLPAGLTATSLSGPSWVCNLPAVSCSRSDALGPGASFPPITLVVSVASVTPAVLVNTVTVSGALETNVGNNGDTDPTTIVQAADLAIGITHSGDFIKLSGGHFLINVTNAGAGPTVGTVTVTGALPEGFDVLAINGGGWTCDAAPAVHCTTTEVLEAGQSLGPIALFGSIAVTAPPLMVFQATVSGGGDVNMANNTASDAAVITHVDVLPFLTHTGALRQGQPATFEVVAGNIGTAATTSSVVVSIAEPFGLTITAAAGTGWSCEDVGEAAICQRGDALASGAVFPPIIVTMNVPLDAPPQMTASAFVQTPLDIDSDNNIVLEEARINPASGLIAPVVTASAVSGTQVQVSWSPVPGATGYALIRSGGLELDLGNTTSYIDSAVTPNNGYAYAVFAYNAADSGPLGTDWTVTIAFDDDPLVAGVTPVRAGHVLQLRAAINALRAMMALPPLSFTNPVGPGAPIRATDIMELRLAIQALRGEVDFSNVRYTNPALAPGRPILATDLQEVRNAVK